MVKKILIAMVVFPGMVFLSGSVVLAEEALNLSDEYIQIRKEFFPSSAGEIDDFRRTINGVSRAINADIYPTLPQKRSIALNLKIGEDFPTLYTNPGFISAVTFSDETGAPWPISGIVNGNPEAYEITLVGDAKSSNMVSISPLRNHVRTNIMISLAHHPVPVTLEMVAGSKDTDFRFDIQIEGRGPNSSPQLQPHSLIDVKDDKFYLGFLHGVIPEGAKPLISTHRDVEAWSYEGHYVLRSKAMLISPAQEASYHDVTGDRLFITQPAPVMYFSFDGRFMTITFEDEEA